MKTEQACGKLNYWGPYHRYLARDEKWQKDVDIKIHNVEETDKLRRHHL